MELLLIVSSDASRAMVGALAGACARSGVAWGCFFTDRAVRLLGDSDFVAGIKAAQRAVVCEHSWQCYMAARHCPLELGSQTTNSAMAAGAARIIGL